MATPETIAEQEGLQGINADYTEKYGFHDAENYLYKAPKGLTKELIDGLGSCHLGYSTSSLIMSSSTRTSNVSTGT